MKIHFGSVLTCGLLMGGVALADGLSQSAALPVPEGLKACQLNDPVAASEARVASKLGLEYLGCFRSERSEPGSRLAAEYAFGMAVQGRAYQPADLDDLLSTVKQQWKDFDPLSKEFKESYTARLNALIKNNGSAATPNTVSVKPVLVSIDRGSGDYYTVTSIRTYVVDLNGTRVTSTKVNSDGVALRGSQLIRLTIQRTLTDPHDVTQVQNEITNWTRATAQSAASRKMK